MTVLLKFYLLCLQIPWDLVNNENFDSGGLV